MPLATMKMQRLNDSGPLVSVLGFGCMAFSGGYGPADDAESIATVHAALDAGSNLLDTGDFYGAGASSLPTRLARST